MTDIPTQAPRDSAVEPAGVSDALPLWHKHAKPFTQGYAVGYDEFVAAIGEARDAARQQLAELQKERDEWMARAGAALLMVPDDKLCGDLRKARDEIDATRQQLAEMRAERDNNDTRRLMFVTHNYKRMNFWGMADDDIRAAIDVAIGEEASPSQPIVSATLQEAVKRCPHRTPAECDCEIDPVRASQPSRGKCETCNGRQRILQPISKTARNPVKPDELVRVQTFVPCPDCAQPEPSPALREAAKAGADAMRQLILLSQTMGAPYIGRHSDFVEIEKSAALLDAFAEGK